ncbi:transcriptional regulator NrdR [Tepidibacter formicigenes]|jgi:transcriptional repressor NrdR|uniref:Transcriptional repressor NrdR n=1 Tax=Tepidibacter formicigenes DSM 15518 TaxID=1123349 RepID=A0A1M6KD96_9FIRM|nr:transcriptional regulator NrdR [Tepidibacter formicigenes]SHJ56868.1 transcriptional repressor NrdR [Tepidibacter formicigenes DSM 15518]
MKCPYCNFSQSKVIDSRPTDEGSSIRRRRECESCKKRFTTYEKVEDITLMVIKKDGNRERFDRSKIINGIIKSCEKRPVSIDVIENIVTDIENSINRSMVREIDSNKIGELVMEKLKEIDEVAYVRFASVYRHFKDINTFLQELEKILNEKR